MAKDNNNNIKLLSVLITLLMGGGIVTIMFFSRLYYEYPPKDADLLQKLQEPIEFGGEEFVEIEDLLAEVNTEPGELGEEIEQEESSQDITAQVQDGQNDLQDKGAVNEPPQPPVSTKNDSPMKVKEQPPKDTKPQTKTQTPPVTDPKKKGDNTTSTTNTNTKTESQKKADDAMNNAFKKGNNGNTTGSNPNGTTGKPSIGGLAGYSAENFPTAPSPGPGTVVVSVVVSPTGKVVKATVTGGSLKGNARACEICRGLALRSTFKVPKNTAVERTGTLTYTVK